MTDRRITVRHGNLIAGAALSLLGAAALWESTTYGLGDWMRVGAGAFPVLVSGIILACGLVIAAFDLFAARLSPSFPVTALRAGAGLFGAVLAFALTIEPLGIIPACAICAFLVSIASSEIHWRHTLATVLILPPLVWLLFVVALGLRVPAFALGS